MSRSRTLAKLFSDTAKPFGARAVVGREAERELLAMMPVTEVSGIGGRRSASAGGNSGIVGRMSDVTRLLEAAGRGDGQAAADLLPLVYDELRKLAAAKLAAEAPGHTLDATALVHEAFLKFGGDRAFATRADYLRAAAQAMRRILVDHAWHRRAGKRGGAGGPGRAGRHRPPRSGAGRPPGSPRRGPDPAGGRPARGGRAGPAPVLRRADRSRGGRPPGGVPADGRRMVGLPDAVCYGWAFSPDESLLAVGRSHEICLYRGPAREPVSFPDAGAYRAERIVFSGDGRVFAAERGLNVVVRKTP